MKSKKNAIIIVLSLLALIFLLSSFGTISLYKSNMTHSISGSWSDVRYFPFDEQADSVNPTDKQAIPVVVVYKSKRVGDTQADNPLIIVLSYIKFKAGWFPLYKKYRCDHRIDYSHSYNTGSGNGQLNIQGGLQFKGELNMYGLSSFKLARNMIEDATMNFVYNSVKNELSKK